MSAPPGPGDRPSGPSGAGGASGGPSDPGTAAGLPGRRALTYAVLAGLVGSAVALYAGTRVWSVQWVPRPAPLPAVREARTGGALLPWLTALAAVGLAGTGAVLATRGPARRLVGLLLLVIGIGLALGGGYGLLVLSRGGAGPFWPALTLLGGLTLAGAAAVTVLRGQRWPTMGARYERPRTVTAGSAGRSDAGRQSGTERVDPGRAAWDALDRGEDPTAG